MEEVHGTLKDVIDENEAKLSADVTVDDVSEAYFVYGEKSNIFFILNPEKVNLL